MDIRDWPLDKIMQLPDCCFGRRYIVSAFVYLTAGALGWAMSTFTLPDRGVVWQLVIATPRDAFELEYFRVALGMKLPAVVSEMNTLSPIFPGFGDVSYSPPRFYFYPTTLAGRWDIKFPIISMSQNLIIEAQAVAAKNLRLTVALIVSSIPTEVPDWLVSGPARNL